jgi:hypothetical protein
MPSRHRWLFRGVRFGLLTLVTELTGRSLTSSLDRAVHVLPLEAPRTSGYPFMLAGVRTVAAVAVGMLAWRLVRAHATACASERLLDAVGGRRARAPRLRVALSWRGWLVSFGATTLWFLVQDDYGRLSDGRWPLLAPWLHTYALPVFAVLSLVLAVAWGLVRDWVDEVERYAAATFAHAFPTVPLAGAGRVGLRSWRERPPRQLYGHDFESRPPPLPA